MSITECPRCGYRRGRMTEANPHLPVEQPTSWMRPVDISALQAGLRRIENSISSFEKSISRLIKVKCLILRRTNTMQAATRHLPSEILSLIFQIARPSIDFDTHYLNLEKEYTNTFHAKESVLYVLTAVCHHWRQVALSTSQLWTTVRLKVNPYSTFHLVHPKVSLLDLHFQRARNAPLSIELDFGELPFAGPHYLENGSDFEMHYDETRDIRESCLEDLEPLQTAVFFEKAPMIQHLLLIRPPAEWYPLINENLSLCNSLTVYQPETRMIEDDDDEPIDDVLDLTRLPSLQHVQLVDHFHDTLIPETVTTLHLRDMYPSICVQLLLRCRNIVNFEVVGFARERRPIFQVREPVSFPDMEHFRWCNVDLSTEDSPGLDLIQHIQLPRLRSLIWADDDDGVPEQDSNEDPRYHFFSHLPPSLSSLTLVKMCYNPQNSAIEHILPCVSHVTELHLDECPVMTITAAVKAIGRPLPRQERRSREPSSVIRVLPNLRKFTITSSTLELEDLPLEEIAGMLETLHAASATERRERFYLHIDLITDWDEDEQIWSRLRALVKDGFNLEIRVDSRILDLGI